MPHQRQGDCGHGSPMVHKAKPSLLGTDDGGLVPPEPAYAARGNSLIMSIVLPDNLATFALDSVRL
jgi:hypothetical protein